MADDHDEVRQDLAAFALDALDPAERARVETHLRGCEACQRELAEHRTVLGLLPHHLDLATPPPSAKPALLARLRMERAAGTSPCLIPSIARRLGLWERLRPTGPTLRWAAAGLVIAGLLGWNVHLQRQVANPEAAVSVETLATLPDGRMVALLGTGRPGATARLFVDRDGRRGELVIAGLAPLPPERTYQLWFARPGQPTVTGGAFRVDGRGETVAPVAIPAPLDEVRAIAVTEEPVPGSPAPTGQHLLDARL
jgi:anti-sigma-K factor RskA